MRGGVAPRQLHDLAAEHELNAIVSCASVATDEFHRWRAHKTGHECVRRPVVELLGRVDLLEPAVAEHGDAIAHRHRLDLVMGDVHGRDTEQSLDPRDLETHLDSELGVEVREGSSMRKACGLRTIARPMATR